EKEVKPMQSTATTAMGAVSQRVRGAFDAVELKAWRAARTLLSSARTVTGSLNQGIQAALGQLEERAARALQEREQARPSGPHHSPEPENGVGTLPGARDAAGVLGARVALARNATGTPRVLQGPRRSESADIGLFQERKAALGVEGRTEEVALPDIAPLRLQKLGLFACFDAFGDNRQVETPGHGDDGRRDSRIVDFAGHSLD